VLDDLRDVTVRSVFHRGSLVADRGHAVFSVKKATPSELGNTVNVKPFGRHAFTALAPSDRTHVLINIIEIVPGQIITRKTTAEVEIAGGAVMPDPTRDLLKAVVLERHRGTGNIGIGFVKGFGLKRGALASSISHDSHNIVAVGVDDASIRTAVKEIARLQGGLVAAEGPQVLAALPLPVAGLLSEMSLEDTVQHLAHLERVASRLGTTLSSPFSPLSFLALPVIPELRLTDLGLVDVNQFRTIPLSTEEPVTDQ